MWTGFSLPFHWGFRNRFLRDDELTVCSSLSHLQQGLLANTPEVLSRGLELLISEVSEPFIRDQTSRITPASVSSRGTSCSERLSSKPRGRTLYLSISYSYMKTGSSVWTSLSWGRLSDEPFFIWENISYASIVFASHTFLMGGDGHMGRSRKPLTQGGVCANHRPEPKHQGILAKKRSLEKRVQKPSYAQNGLRGSKNRLDKAEGALSLGGSEKAMANLQKSAP